MFKEILRPAVMLIALFIALTGGVYPLLITGIAQLAFPRAATGSLIRRDRRAMGSELIGQPFTRPEYFWGRPSATAPYPYNASASSGSNLGPSNPGLATALHDRIALIGTANRSTLTPVPIDLVTTSASGLDPHITPAAALYQIDRISKVRQLAPTVVKKLVNEHLEVRTFGLLGEPRVNVLRLNLALDAMSSPKH